MEAQTGDGRPEPPEHAGDGTGPTGWSRVPGAVLRWYGRCLTGSLRGEIDAAGRGFARSEPPSTSAEGTATRARPIRGRRPWLRRFIAAALLTTAATAITIVYGGALTSIFQGRAERNSLRPPFYTSRGLATVREGMTEGEVRDRVGYPLERWWARGANQTWVYSVPAGRHDTYLFARVTFDGETGRVISAREDVMRCGPRAVPQGQPGLAAVVGTVVLTRHDGTRRLAPSDPAPRVFLWAGADTGRRMTPERVVRALESGGAGPRAECLLVDSRARAAGEGPVAADRVFRDGPFRRSETGPTLLGVYHGGCLYGLPPDQLGDDEAQRLEDVKWLISRLGRG